jgi:Flp pilus assembly protein TadD
LEQASILSEALDTNGSRSKDSAEEPELWNSRGQMLEKNNRVDEAYRSFTTAIELADAKAETEARRRRDST